MLRYKKQRKGGKKMLKLNGNIVEIYKFPDGTPRMALDVENLEKHEKNGTLCFEIEWLYEKNEELFFLILLKRHLDAHSDVSAALLNRCVNENPKPYIQEVIKQLPEGTVLYFPERGFAANNIAYGVGAFCFTAIVENGRLVRK